MGLFPTKVFQCDQIARTPATTPGSRLRKAWGPASALTSRRHERRINATRLTLFTRQLATLLEAGMPVLRGLRVLGEQEENHRLKRVIGDLCESIENGGSLAEALAQHPRVFNRLYVNMVRAGEVGGALESALTRLAECLEKSQKIKGKIKSALAYPCAVMVVAGGILALLRNKVSRHSCRS